jgi:hypothetical protein
MADKITIKTKDICDALNIGRHQLRSWTDALAPYSYRQTKERSAFKYDSADLLYFALVKHIIENFGLSLPFVARFSEALYSCVREPQSLTQPQFLFISEQGTSCVRASFDKIDREGFLVDINPAQTVVHQFFGLSAQQTQLQLGLVKVN